MHLAYVNQDPGIQAKKRKGARVHVESMLRAFESLDAKVTPIEAVGAEIALNQLYTLHAECPLDVVYERYSLGSEAGAQFALSAHVPFVLEVNAPLLDEAAAHRGRVVDSKDRIIEQRVFRSATRIHAVSSDVANYAVRAGADPKRVHVRPNAVDSERFVPSSDARVRSEHVPNDRLVLGFHGRLRPWHGFDRLARAASDLVALGVPIHVMTVGEGDFAAVLASVLEPDRYTVLPWVAHDEVPELVACFDVLPLTYAPDAPCYFSPLKLLEAMACGVVPVVPTLGDLTEVCQHERNGLVYDPSMPNALVEQVLRLARDRELRARLSERSVATARLHSWRSQAEEVLHSAPQVRS